MRRATLNFIVDLIGLVDLLLLAGTGSIMKWVLPPGSGGGGRGLGYGFRGGRGFGPGGGQVRQWLGLGRHDWGDIHFILALVFVGVILLHVVLHWAWIKAYVQSAWFPARQVPQEVGSEPQIR